MTEIEQATESEIEVEESKAPEPPPPPPKLFYSAKAGGFFTDALHKPEHIPDDATEITHDEWQAVLNEQSQGKQIVGGPDGKPISIDRVVTPAMKRRSLLAQMQKLATSTEAANAQRGVTLGKAGAKQALQAIDDKIEALRAQLPPEEPT